MRCPILECKNCGCDLSTIEGRINGDRAWEKKCPCGHTNVARVKTAPRTGVYASHPMGSRWRTIAVHGKGGVS